MHEYPREAASGVVITLRREERVYKRSYVEYGYIVVGL